jgi:transaldolase
MDSIEIYYDGVNIDKYNDERIQGFTTNISFLKLAGISNYDEFIKGTLKYTNRRPISFQLYDDDEEIIKITAKKIQSYDPSIFVKIPVINTEDKYNNIVIKQLHDEKIQINVTAIFTKQQINSIKYCFNKETPVIISIFGGKINDCGIDSTEIVQHAVETFKEYKNIKILWAACRTIYNIFDAIKQGAHIVTVPDSVIDRFHRISQTLEESALSTVQTFKKDGIDGNIHL